MPGSVFLREARRCAPTAVRMLLTGYADTDAAAAGRQRRPDLPLPDQAVRPPSAQAGVRRRARAPSRAGRRARAARADAARLDQGADRGAGARQPGRLRPQRAAEGADRRRSLAPPAPATPWEIEVASMLVNLGAVTLPEATAEKLHSGGALEPNEVGMVDRIPEVTRPDPGSIPRLEGVREIVAGHTPALRLRRCPRARGCCGSRVDFVRAGGRGRRGVPGAGDDARPRRRLRPRVARDLRAHRRRAHAFAGGLRGPARRRSRSACGSSTTSAPATAAC